MAPAPDPRQRAVLQQLAEADVESERLHAVEQRLEAFLSRRRMVQARRNAAALHVRVGEALAGISRLALGSSGEGT